MNNAFNGMPNMTANGFYNPYQSSYQMALQSQQNVMQTAPVSITFVNGIEGAKGYMLPPNSSVVLMDSDSSRFYIKSTNGAGMAEITAYKFTEDSTPSDKDQYVKKSEINRYIDEYLCLVRGSGNVKSNQEADK